jgi:hypothetical protein
MRTTAFIAVLLLASTAEAQPIMGRWAKNGQAPAAAAASSDYTQSLYLTGPAVGAQCTNAAITTDQAGAITVTRASTSYCQNGSGTFTLIDANKAVVESDGLRVEPSSSNRVPSSEPAGYTEVNGAYDTETPYFDPVTATQVYAWGSTTSGGYLESPSFTAGSTSGVLSLWVQGFGQTVNFILRDTTAGVDRCTGSTAASGTWQTMKARPSVVCSSLTSGNTHVARLYPGGTADVGSAIFYGVQFEPGVGAKTSYIHTTGTAVTRAADAITTTITDNSAAGCVGATMLASSPAFPQRIFTKGSDLAAFNSATSIFTSDTTNTVNSPNVTNVTNRNVPVRVQWGGGALRADLDSSTGTPGSFDGSMGSGTTLNIGSNSGVQQLHGWLKAIKVSTSNTGCTP